MREIVITEKIDGTNASIHIGEDGSIRAASRTRWITPAQDNYGFAKFVESNKEELLKLGPGSHFGEWWGNGIQRGYGLRQKQFSLFNTGKWSAETPPPGCCLIVPVLYRGIFSEHWIEESLTHLRVTGSQASPGFMNPEGIIIYHCAGDLYFKRTLDKDEEWKGKSA